MNIIERITKCIRGIDEGISWDNTIGIQYDFNTDSDNDIVKLVESKSAYQLPGALQCSGVDVGLAYYAFEYSQHGHVVQSLNQAANASVSASVAQARKTARILERLRSDIESILDDNVVRGQFRARNAMGECNQTIQDAYSELKQPNVIQIPYNVATTGPDSILSYFDGQVQQAFGSNILATAQTAKSQQQNKQKLDLKKYKNVFTQFKRNLRACSSGPIKNKLYIEVYNNYIDLLEVGINRLMATVNLKGFDTILYPKSESGLAEDIANAIGTKINITPQEAFTKGTPRFELPNGQPINPNERVGRQGGKIVTAAEWLNGNLGTNRRTQWKQNILFAKFRNYVKGKFVANQVKAGKSILLSTMS